LVSVTAFTIFGIASATTAVFFSSFLTSGLIYLADSFFAAIFFSS